MNDGEKEIIKCYKMNHTWANLLPELLFYVGVALGPMCPPVNPGVTQLLPSQLPYPETRFKIGW